MSAQGTMICTNTYYCGVDEVMELVGVKRRKAYMIISTLRKELIDTGKLTPEYPAGRVPRKYLEEKLMIE